MDQAMKSMKFSKGESQMPEPSIIGGGPEFPYGLKICLNQDVLKRLNLGALPIVGQTMGLHAIVEVVGVHSDPNNQTGGKNFSVELQITDMELQRKSTNGPETIYDKAENQMAMAQPKTLLGGSEGY